MNPGIDYEWVKIGRYESDVDCYGNRKLNAGIDYEWVKIGRYKANVGCYGNRKSDLACFGRKLKPQLLLYIIDVFFMNLDLDL